MSFSNHIWNKTLCIFKYSHTISGETESHVGMGIKPTDKVKTVINKARSGHWENLPEMLVEDVVGLVSIGKAEQPCNGAWEVRKAIGPNAGKFVYGMGYWLSPTHTLISDRGSMTDSAVKAWMKQSGGKMLDDYKNPKNNDPNDDCEVWKGDANGTINSYNESDIDFLPIDAADKVNRSYTNTSAVFDYESMLQRGNKLIAGLDVSKLTTMLKMTAAKYFIAHY